MSLTASTHNGWMPIPSKTRFALATAALMFVFASRGTPAAAQPAGTDAASKPSAPSQPSESPLQVPLGVTYSAWRGGFAQAEQRLLVFKNTGFRLVSLVPAYPYVGLNDVDLNAGPSPEELGAAVEAALRMGLQVVIKPHLEPLLHTPGFNSFTNENASWRARCSWRGYFDVDPMTVAYREGILFSTLNALKNVFNHIGDLDGKSVVRLDLGAELMNAVVYAPAQWEKLLRAVQRERDRLGLRKRVALSHNFSHHFEIAQDFVDRMDARGRAALGRYLRGLDGIAISQYMDLTVAVPAAERGKRMPTPDEIAQALVIAERNVRNDILIKRLGMRDTQIPPLHLGEFGIGLGGLQHPNLWSGNTSKDYNARLPAAIAQGHRGLLRYLSMSQAEGRTVQTAVLWVTGMYYDVFGWGNVSYGVPEAAEVLRAGMRSH